MILSDALFSVVQETPVKYCSVGTSCYSCGVFFLKMDCGALAFEVAFLVEQRVPPPVIDDVGHVGINDRVDLTAIRSICRLLQTVSVGDDVARGEMAGGGIFRAPRLHPAQGDVSRMAGNCICGCDSHSCAESLQCRLLFWLRSLRTSRDENSHNQKR